MSYVRIQYTHICTRSLTCTHKHTYTQYNSQSAMCPDIFCSILLIFKPLFKAAPNLLTQFHEPLMGHNPQFEKCDSRLYQGYWIKSSLPHPLKSWDFLVSTHENVFNPPLTERPCSILLGTLLLFLFFVSLPLGGLHLGFSVNPSLSTCHHLFGPYFL